MPSAEPYIASMLDAMERDRLMRSYDRPEGDQVIAIEVQRIAAGVDALCRTQERLARVLVAILEKNTELLDRYITDTRVAELKADRWEAEARRLRSERQD